MSGRTVRGPLAMGGGVMGRAQAPGVGTAQLFDAPVAAFDPYARERDYDVERKRNKRAEGRDIQLPPCVNPARRKACRDPLLFLRTYFPHHFFLAFTDCQKEIVATVTECMLLGGNQAIAEPRGSGKTTILEFLSFWALYYEVYDLLLFVAASNPAAEARLGELRLEAETNDLLLEDFPEFVFPVRALEGSSQRAAVQTVGGDRTLVSWTGDRIVFPTIRGTAARGQTIVTRGIESEIRGVKHNGRRPQFALVDDIQTRESAYSVSQCIARRDIIDRDIGGAGDVRTKMSCVALLTVIRKGDAADQLVDRTTSPVWQGIRRKLLETLPDNTALWDEYIDQYREDQRGGDRFARRANAYYMANREAMDAGAVCAAPLRYYGRHMAVHLVRTLVDSDDSDIHGDAREEMIQALRGGELRGHFSPRFRDMEDETVSSLRTQNVLPDGSEIEVSALQHCYNIIAEKGQHVFDSEYQNEPEDTSDLEHPPLTAADVLSKLNTMPRKKAPRGCDTAVAFIDPGATECHWVVCAFGGGFAGALLDADAQAVETGPLGGVEAAITTAVDRVIGTILTPGRYYDHAGDPLPIARILVDSGEWTHLIYALVERAGDLVRPYKGEPGHRIMRPPRLSPANRGPGWYYATTRTSRIRLVHADVDYWKAFTHERIRTPIGGTGSFSLWGTSERVHHLTADHLTAESPERRTRTDGSVFLKFVQQPGRPNHRLDCVVGCHVAASMAGIGLTEPTEPAAPAETRGTQAGWFGAMRRSK